MYISNPKHENSMHLGDGGIPIEEQCHIGIILKSNQF